MACEVFAPLLKDPAKASRTVLGHETQSLQKAFPFVNEGLGVTSLVVEKRVASFRQSQLPADICEQHVFLAQEPVAGCVPRVHDVTAFRPDGLRKVPIISLEAYGDPSIRIPPIDRALRRATKLGQLRVKASDLCPSPARPDSEKMAHFVVGWEERHTNPSVLIVRGRCLVVVRSFVLLGDDGVIGQIGPGFLANCIDPRGQPDELTGVSAELYVRGNP